MSKVVAKGMDIPVDKIKPSPYQPRLNFDLEDIRESIERDGILIGLTVRDKDEYYELVDGERRLRLSKELGYETVPCDIVDIDDETARRMVYKVNKARKNYTPHEEAVFFSKLVEEEGMKPYEVETQLGVSHHWVQACLNIWKFPKEIQDNVFGLARGPIPYRVYMTDVRELESTINRNLDEAVEILRQIIKERMTADEKRELIGRREKKIDKDTLVKAEEAIEKIAPELKTPETSEEFLEAAKVFRKRAKELKTPEQIMEEKRGQARNALLTGRGNAKSKIVQAKNEGIETSEFEKRLEEIEAKISTDPEEALKEAIELKKKVDSARNEYKERARAKKDIENKIRRALDLGIDVSGYKQRLADLVAGDTIKDERESFIEEIDGAIHAEEVEREKERIRKEAQAEVDRDDLEDVIISDPEEAERILIWQSTEGLPEEDRKSLVTKAEAMGWSSKSLAKITKALIDMDPNNIELILAEDSSIGQSEIIELGTLKEPELQKTIIEYLQKFDLGTRRSLRVIERAKNKDYAWGHVASRPEDLKPGSTGLNYRLLRRIERTFYNIRAIGVPSMGIMGPKLWKEAQIYIRGQMDWCRFLLSLNPEVSEEDQPSLPDMSYISVDDVRVKIIEAEYRVLDEHKNS